MICIYSITHIDSGKVYIGSTTNLKVRWRDHKKTLRGNRHDNRYLQNAWNKYREDSFSFKVIEECGVNILLDREKFWFNKTSCCDRNFGFNIVIDPNSGGGWKHTKKSKDKMSGPRESIRGIKNPKSKLKPNDIKIIRELLGDNVSLGSIAKKFNVGVGAIWKIKKGINWSYIK